MSPDNAKYSQGGKNLTTFILMKTVGLGILGRLSIKSQKYAEEYSTTHK